MSFIVGGMCKSWTLDSGLDSWTGLWTGLDSRDQFEHAYVRVRARVFHFTRACGKNGGEVTSGGR